MVRNSVFDCNLSPNWRQMTIENTVSSDLRPAFVNCSKRFRLPPIRRVLCPEDCFIKANRLDPDEIHITHSVASQLGLLCLSKYLFKGLQYIRGKWIQASIQSRTTIGLPKKRHSNGVSLAYCMRGDQGYM